METILSKQVLILQPFIDLVGGLVTSVIQAILAFLLMFLNYLLNNLLFRMLWEVFALDRVFTDLILKIPTKSDPYIFDIDMWSIIDNAYKDVSIIGYTILGFTLFLAFTTLAFENIRLLPKGMALSILRRGVWGALFIFLLPYLWNFVGDVVNALALPGRILLPYSMDDMARIFTERFDLRQLMGNYSIDSIEDAGQAFGLIIVGLAGFFIMLMFIVVIYVFGLLKVLLTIFGFMIFPIAVAFTIIPRLGRLMDRFIDLLLAMLIAPIFSSLILRATYEILLARLNVQPGIIDPLFLYVGLFTSTIIAIFMIPVLGDVFGMIKSTVERGFMMASTVAGTAIGVGVGMTAGAVAGAMGYGAGVGRMAVAGMKLGGMTGLKAGSIGGGFIGGGTPVTGGGAVGGGGEDSGGVVGSRRLGGSASGSGESGDGDSSSGGDASPPGSTGRRGSVSFKSIVDMARESALKVGGLPGRATVLKGFVAATAKGALMGAKIGWEKGSPLAVASALRLGWSAGKSEYHTRIEAGDIASARGLASEMLDAAVNEDVDAVSELPPEVIEFAGAFQRYSYNPTEENLIQLKTAMEKLGYDIRSPEALKEVARIAEYTPGGRAFDVGRKIGFRLHRIRETGGLDFREKARNYEANLHLYHLSQGYITKDEEKTLSKMGYRVDILKKFTGGEDRRPRIITRTEFIKYMNQYYGDKRLEGEPENIDEIRSFLANAPPEQYEAVFNVLEEELPVLGGKPEGEQFKDYILRYGDEETLRNTYRMLNRSDLETFRSETLRRIVMESQGTNNNNGGQGGQTGTSGGSPGGGTPVTGGGGGESGGGTSGSGTSGARPGSEV